MTSKREPFAYCSAGHHPSYLVAEPRERAIPLKTRNIMIGTMPAFEFESSSVEVPAGSRLYVFSDGIFEIESKDGEQWGLDHVLPLIVEPPVQGMTEPERLLHAIRGHAKRPDFDDDFTVSGRDVSLAGPGDAPAHHEAIASVDAPVFDRVGKPAHECHPSRPSVRSSSVPASTAPDPGSDRRRRHRPRPRPDLALGELEGHRDRVRCRACEAVANGVAQDLVEHDVDRVGILVASPWQALNSSTSSEARRISDNRLSITRRIMGRMISPCIDHAPQGILFASRTRAKRP
jgi:hypothetical protein